MSLLLVEALSSLLFDGSDVVASRRSFVVISSLCWLMLPQLLVAAMPSGHVEMQATMLDESHSVAAQSWASI